MITLSPVAVGVRSCHGNFGPGNFGPLENTVRLCKNWSGVEDARISYVFFLEYR